MKNLGLIFLLLINSYTVHSYSDHVYDQPDPSQGQKLRKNKTLGPTTIAIIALASTVFLGSAWHLKTASQKKAEQITPKHKDPQKSRFQDLLSSVTNNLKPANQTTNHTQTINRLKKPLIALGLIGTGLFICYSYSLTNDNSSSKYTPISYSFAHSFNFDPNIMRDLFKTGFN